MNQLRGTREVPVLRELLDSKSVIKLLVTRSSLNFRVGERVK